MEKQKTVNKIFLMGLRPIKSASTVSQKRALVPSGAPAERLTVGAMIQKRRKIDGDQILQEAEKRNGKDDRSDKKSQKRLKKAAQKENPQKSAKEGSQSARRK